MTLRTRRGKGSMRESCWLRGNILSSPQICSERLLSCATSELARILGGKLDRGESLVPRRGTMMGLNVFGGLAWAMNSPPLPALSLSVSFRFSHFVPAQTVGQKETYFARMRRAHKVRGQRCPQRSMDLSGSGACYCIVCGEAWLSKAGGPRRMTR